MSDKIKVVLPEDFYTNIDLLLNLLKKASLLERELLKHGVKLNISLNNANHRLIY